MLGFIITLIQVTASILTLIVLIDVILSFFLNPFHPLRQTLDTIIEPLLAPIRQIMPQTGMLDFSPLILLILIQLIESILVQILLSL